MCRDYPLQLICIWFFPERRSVAPVETVLGSTAAAPPDRTPWQCRARRHLTPRVAVQLFLHMCDCGIQADAVTCCSLINAMDRAGLWQVAELVLLALCARMPAFHDMRAQPPLDLAAVLDAAERSLVQTLCLRLSGGSDDASWPESPSDSSPLSRLGAPPHFPLS